MDAGELDLNDLYTASQGIEECTIGPINTYGYHRLLSEVSNSQQDYINRYIRAITSGGSLKSLLVNMGGATNVGPSRYRIGSALDGLNFCSLRCLTMEGMLFDITTLTALCRNLGSELQVFHLENIEVGEDSGWCDVMDILREKLSFRAIQGKVNVFMDRLVGGGIDVDTDSTIDTYSPTCDSIFTKCTDYVRGGHGGNPLAPPDGSETE